MIANGFDSHSMTIGALLDQARNRPVSFDQATFGALVMAVAEHMTRNKIVPDDPDSCYDLSRRMVRHGRRRTEIFGRMHFADPGWSIMLDLYQRRIEGKVTPVTSACIASGVPTTTALRCIAYLEKTGLIERREHPSDGRTSHVSLTDYGCTAVFDLLSYW